MAGLEARALKASKDRLKDLPLPAILHWESNHWVVLYAVDEQRVRIADPARGLRRVSRAEVQEKWSGWCATFRRTAALNEAPVEHLDLSWLRSFVRPLRTKFAIATVLAIVAVGLQLLSPVLTQRVVDTAAKREQAEVSLLIALVVGLAAARTRDQPRSSDGCSRGRQCDWTRKRSISSPGAYSSCRCPTSRRAGPPTSSAASTVCDRFAPSGPGDRRWSVWRDPAAAIAGDHVQLLADHRRRFPRDRTRATPG